MIAAFPAAEIADAMLPRFLVRPALVLRTCPTTATKAKLFGEPGSAFRVAPVRSLHVQPTASSKAILIDGQFMAGIRDAV
jgi:hypothetical protein